MPVSHLYPLIYTQLQGCWCQHPPRSCGSWCLVHVRQAPGARLWQGLRRRLGLNSSSASLLYYPFRICLPTLSHAVMPFPARPVFALSFQTKRTEFLLHSACGLLRLEPTASARKQQSECSILCTCLHTQFYSAASCSELGSRLHVNAATARALGPTRLSSDPLLRSLDTARCRPSKTCTRSKPRTATLLSSRTRHWTRLR